MLFGDFHYCKYKSEHEIVAELALIAGDKTKNHGFWFTVCTVSDNNAFFHYRLVNRALNFCHHIAKF
jgi:hypothetical protein